MKLFTGISSLVQPHSEEGLGDVPLEVTEDAALLVQAQHIVAVGPRAQIAALPEAKSARPIDLGGRAVVPGLVDSHTHVVFAGERIDDLARRSRGDTYESIARAGGGIAQTARLCAEASVDTLVHTALPRLHKMLARGTTTCEIKSGYGLLPEHELKMLGAIEALAHDTPIKLHATVLAHLVPPAFAEARDAYVDLFIQEILTPASQMQRVAFCDVFVERTAFSRDEARRIAAAAKGLGLGIKLHVDQLHDGGGAELAAELCATSADHLEYCSEAGRKALAKRDVVATLLPGCRFFLGHGPWPSGRALRQAGCQVAVATDCNPGSAMVTDLLLCGTLAATQCGLTLEEALWGITRGGARALGLTDRGRLVAHQRADFVVADHSDWRALFYYPASPPIHAVFVGGEDVTPNPSN